MSEHVTKLLTLYENGIIDGDALNTALKALNAPPPQEPQKKTLTDKARERRRRKKKRRKQRKAEIAANQKNEAPRESPFQLVDKTKCGYLRAHEISVKRYKDPVKMFQDKKPTIKKQDHCRIARTDRIKMVFRAYC